MQPATLVIEMVPTPIQIVRDNIPRSALGAIAENQFGDLVKAVVDVNRSIMAIGGELHSDEEAVLMDDGSKLADLWGINLYPDQKTEDWLEFDAVINVHPAQGNRSRGVESEALRATVRRIVDALVSDQ